MILREKSGVPYLQFPNLSSLPSIHHGIFTREGGSSKAPYSSLNISYNVGDQKDCVIRNRRIIYACMDEAQLVFAEQVHGCDILLLEDDPQLIQGALSAPRNGDAIVTQTRGKNLVLQVADCQPVLMYDPIRQVVANVHCGWRGSIQDIVGRTINVMKIRFGSDPRNIIAGVGPSLGPCCAEFINYQKEIPRLYWKYIDHSVFFDFWAITRDQMIETGVLASNIYISRICTKCNTGRFFSYRKEKETGRFAAVIGLI